MKKKVSKKEEQRAIEILESLPEGNSPDKILYQARKKAVLSIADEGLLLRFFNCSLHQLGQRIFEWKQANLEVKNKR